MPYNPKAITEHDRTYAYKAMWAGMPLSIVLLVSLQFPSFSQLSILTGGFVCGLFMGQAWSWSYDEFMREEVAFASGWALSFAGVVLFLAILPNSFRVEFPAADVLAAMAVVFHGALTYRRIEDGALEDVQP